MTHLSLAFIKISEEKILKIIRALDPIKSSGWDKLSPRVIEYCDCSIVVLLKIIFETSIREGIFSRQMENAKYMPYL